MSERRRRASRRPGPELGPESGPDSGSALGREGLAPRDLELWRHVTRTTQPLKGRRQGIRPELANGSSEPDQQPHSNRKRAQPVPVPLQPRATPRQAKPRDPELNHGSIIGVAKAQAERLRRGQLPIEARLDLHGHTQEEAHRALDDFLAWAQTAGKRCVLVVTGRGLAKRDGGVLRRAVPQWLNQAPNRARILAFDQAQPRHGGAGALYVLVKRRRV